MTVNFRYLYPHFFIFFNEKQSYGIGINIMHLTKTLNDDDNVVVVAMEA